MKYECEWNWELYTALHNVFHVDVVRSIGQVDEMEFDEIGQRDSGHTKNDKIHNKNNNSQLTLSFYN